MIKQIHILLIILLSFASCETKQSSLQKENDIASSRHEIDRIIETDLTRGEKFYNHIFIRNQLAAKHEFIDSLNYHFDSLQIRLWIIGGLFPNHSLYSITRKKSIWTGTYYDLQPDKNYITGRGTNEFLKGSLPLEIHKSKSIRPKLGWTKFIDSLISLDILTLPDMDEVPKMKVNSTDSPYMIIEVSTKDKYRFYGYSSPYQFIDSFWQAKKVSSIQNLFYTEFSR